MGRRGPFGSVWRPTLVFRISCLPRSVRLSILLALLVCGCGCTTVPVGVKRVGTARAYEQINANALATDSASDESRQILHRYDLEETFRHSPDEALRKLHALACLERRRDILFALADLSYLAGNQARIAQHKPPPDGQRGSELLMLDQTEGRVAATDYYLASAICAYLFLFGDSVDPPPTAFDRRFRTACDLYNLGLAEGFKDPWTGDLHAEHRILHTVCGNITLDLSPVGAGGRTNLYSRFVAADDYLVRGLSARSRQAGLGVPIIAVPRAQDNAPHPSFGFMPSGSKVPATAFLRIQGQVCDLAAGTLKGLIEVYSPFETSEITVENRRVPLETDLTVALAYGLQESPFWKVELKQFFSGEQHIRTGAYLTQPYRPGRIPVVFIHGTASSPARWAEMLNTLEADPDLREHFQFWYFTYNTGNPIPYSASLLRESLEQIVRTLDPDRTNAALSQMVLVGHSQGGLLARMMALDHEVALRQSPLAQALSTLKLSETNRLCLSNYFSFRPFPGVRRVIYLATPHRGSYRIGSFVERWGRRLIHLPGTLVNLGEDVATQNPQVVARVGGIHVPTSVDQMKPGCQFLNTMQSIPLAPEVKSHSIIAVQEEGPLQAGKDGVVAYSSAHLNETESELVVNCGHSCQDHPLAIQEVRRILLKHLAGIRTGNQ